MFKGDIAMTAYIEEKLRMLEEDFKFKLNKKEKEHMRSLQTEIQVDRYARTLFKKYLK